MGKKIDLFGLWYNEYKGENDRCILCKNTGIIKTAENTSKELFCVCPNGRIRRSETNAKAKFSNLSLNNLVFPEFKSEENYSDILTIEDSESLGQIQRTKEYKKFFEKLEKKFTKSKRLEILDIKTLVGIVVRFYPKLKILRLGETELRYCDSSIELSPILKSCQSIEDAWKFAKKYILNFIFTYFGDCDIDNTIEFFNKTIEEI